MSEPIDAAKLITDDAVLAACRAFERMLIERGILSALAVLTNQIMRVPAKFRQGTIAELTRALEAGFTVPADPAASAFITDYKTELNFAGAYLQSRIAGAANPKVALIALAHVLGQVAIQLPCGELSAAERVGILTEAMTFAADQFSTLTTAQRARRDRARFDA